jgi:hypothetical protein
MASEGQGKQSPPREGAPQLGQSMPEGSNPIKIDMSRYRKQEDQQVQANELGPSPQQLEAAKRQREQRQR